MTAHELAKHLLGQPDYPVIMNGWGSDEGQDVEVTDTQVIDTPVQTTKGLYERKQIHLLHEELKW